MFITALQEKGKQVNMKKKLFNVPVQDLSIHICTLSGR